MERMVSMREKITNLIVSWEKQAEESQPSDPCYGSDNEFSERLIKTETLDQCAFELRRLITDE